MSPVDEIGKLTCYSKELTIIKMESTLNLASAHCDSIRNSTYCSAPRCSEI